MELRGVCSERPAGSCSHLRRMRTLVAPALLRPSPRDRPTGRLVLRKLRHKRQPPKRQQPDEGSKHSLRWETPPHPTHPNPTHTPPPHPSTSPPLRAPPHRLNTLPRPHPSTSPPFHLPNPFRRVGAAQRNQRPGGKLCRNDGGEDGGSGESSGDCISTPRGPKSLSRSLK